MRQEKSLWRKIIFSLILAVLVFFFLGIYADFGNLIEAFAKFKIIYIVPILTLASFNYVIRFLRWHYYVNVLNLKVEVETSAIIFFTGLAMSITPGKLGELLKCLLLKEKKGVKISTSAPIVISERYTDLIAVLLLLAMGAIFYSVGRIVLLLGLLIVFFLFFLFTSSHFLVERIGNFLSRFSVGLYLVQGTKESVKGFRKLLVGRKLILGTLLGVLAWFCECIAFYLVFIGFGWQKLSLFPATFIYALSTLAGALSMLPGGLGVTEGSMTALLVAFQLKPSISAAATLIIRACTLWFAVIVGLFSYLFHRKMVKKAVEEVLEGKFSERESPHAS